MPTSPPGRYMYSFVFSVTKNEQAGVFLGNLARWLFSFGIKCNFQLAVSNRQRQAATVSHYTCAGTWCWAAGDDRTHREEHDIFPGALANHGFGQITDRRVVEQQDGVLAIQCYRFLQAPFDADAPRR